MYAVVRRYALDPKNAREVHQKVKDGFVPILRNLPGFVAYYWLDNGTGTAVSMGVFNDKAGADESVRQAAEFVRKNLVGLLGTPEVIEGEVKAHG
jgi:hypothetical protein